MRARFVHRFLLLGVLSFFGISSLLRATETDGKRALLKIRPMVQAPETLRIEGVWVLRAVDRSEGEPVQIPASAAEVLFPLTREQLGTWELALEAPGYWAPREMVTLREGETVANPQVWPLGRVEGILKVEKPTDRLPAAVEVAVLIPSQPGSRKVPQGRAGCQIAAAEDGKSLDFSCLLPAAKLDLSFQPQGFAPFYARGVSIDAKKELRLAPQTLQKGGSLAGWVVTDGGRLEAGLGRVRLLPFTAGGQNPQMRRSLESDERSLALQGDGSFSLTGLPPGIYRLFVEHAGFASSSAGPLEVQAGRETLVREPLLLRRPLDLSLLLSPAVDGLGRPWTIHLVHQETTDPRSPSPPLDLRATAEGKVVAKNIAQGTYWLTISDSLENDIHSDLNFRVEGSGVAEERIQLEVWTVHGTIKSGKEPLAAQLWFGGSQGVVRVRFESDKKGEFHGLLPRTGTWQVQIKTPGAPPSERLERFVEAVVEKVEEGEARVDITLPDARIAGRVVDENGAPVRGAWVSLSRGQKAIDWETDESGNYSSRGLPEGGGALVATSGRGESQRSSEPVEVTLVEGQTTKPSDLVLREGVLWKGTVLASHGPVAGAKVLVMPMSLAQGAGSSVRSSADGVFEARLSSRANSATAIVAAPGYALEAFPLVERTSTLELATAAGSLTLASSVAWYQRGSANLTFVFQDGYPLPLTTLAAWAQSMGTRIDATSQRMTFPALAPGTYLACVGPPLASLSMPLAVWAQTEAKCAEGVIGAGGSLTLSLPDP